MRSRISLFSFVLVGSVLLPYIAHAGIPNFDPIIPAMYSSCPAGWGMLMLIINNLISFLITIAIVFVAPLMIAYAGFLFVVNPVHAAGIEKAKGILLNTIIGIVIALAGYLIVDTLMAVLYKPVNGKSWDELVNWNGVGGNCLTQKGTSANDVLNQAAPGVRAAGGNFNSPPADKTGTACDPAVVMAGAIAGGYPTLTIAQANTLACIAQFESGCGAASTLPNYNWNGAVKLPASTAAGAFQVLLATNHSCYENAACRAAAGVTGNLDCQTGFNPNGTLKTDSASSTAKVQLCLKAAADLSCSASAAACMVQKEPNFSPWQKDANSAKQTECINKNNI